MSLLDKVAFWKKKDDFGSDPFPMDDGFGSGDHGPSFGSEPSSNPFPPQDQGPGSPDFGSSSPDSFGGPQSFTPSPPSTPMGQPAQPTPSFNQADNTEYINSKNLEVISSKIDAVKASLDSINQRLAHLEQIAQGEQRPQRRDGFF